MIPNEKGYNLLKSKRQTVENAENVENAEIKKARAQFFCVFPRFLRL